MRILVTGGAGFIGSNLVKTAVSRGHEVRVLDDLSTGNRDNLDGVEVDLIIGSLLNPAKLDAATRGVESVVHLAALPSVPRSIQDPVASHHANATGTLALLESMRSNLVSHVVAASSSSVYGTNPQLPKSELGWVRPMSPYAVSKLATEQYVLAYQQSFGMESLAFRFFNVYGPGQAPGHAYAAVVPAFLDALVRDQVATVHGDGEQSRDFTFVGTVVELLLQAVEQRTGHPMPVNLAFGTNTTLLELIATMESVANRPLKVEHVASRAGDVRHSQADNGVLRDLFPDVVPVPLEEGITATLNWMMNR